MSRRLLSELHVEPDSKKVESPMEGAVLFLAGVAGGPGLAQRHWR